MPYLEHVTVLYDANNINKDSPFSIAECLIEIGRYFKERSCNVKIIISSIRPGDEYCPVNRIIISKTNDILAYKYSLHGFYFIDQKYDWTRENGMLNPNLYFKYNIHLID